MTLYHTPVLLQESINAMNIKPDGIYVDATFGSGGHSAEILKRLKTGTLIAFDQDESVKKNIIENEKLLFIQHNFRYMKNFLRYNNIQKINGLIADLGVSSHQFDTTGRGFSFRFEDNLDMRMNKNSQLTASDILNQYKEEQLSDIFYYYGELHEARKLSSAIVRYRTNHTFKKTGDLVQCLEKFTPHNQQHKFLARVFQAIRIEVNQELEALKELLEQASEIIETGGRLIIISYHSLEDKIVKNFIRSGQFEGEPEKDLYGNYYTPFKAIGKVVVPSEAEIKLNNRARSAKMRVAEKN